MLQLYPFLTWIAIVPGSIGIATYTWYSHSLITDDADESLWIFIELLFEWEPIQSYCPVYFFKLISLYYSYMQGLIRFSFLSYVLRWAWLYLSLFCQLLFVIYSGLPFYNDIICTSSFNLNWKRMIWNHNFKNPTTNEFTVESSLSLCVYTHTN